MIRKIPWGWALVAIALVWLSVGIVRALVSPPALEPRAEDERVAARVLAPSDRTRSFIPSDGEWVGGNGRVEPRQRPVDVAAAVSGRIARIAVAEGAHVEAGAVLVELEHAVEDAALAAAEAEVESARADLLRALHGNRRQEVAAAIALDAAQSRAALSARALQRVEAVSGAGAVSADEVDRARRQAEIDAALAQQADAQRQLALQGSRAEDVAGARAHVAAAEARRDRDRASRDRMIVLAPIAGEILQSRFEPGELYQPGGDPLLVMGDTSALRVRMDVDERDVARVSIGREARVFVPAHPGRTFEARVVELLGRRMGSPSVRSDDPQQRNDVEVLEVMLAVEDPAGLIVGQRVLCYVSVRDLPSPAR